MKHGLLGEDSLVRGLPSAISHAGVAVLSCRHVTKEMMLLVEQFDDASRWERLGHAAGAH